MKSSFIGPARPDARAEPRGRWARFLGSAALASLGLQPGCSAQQAPAPVGSASSRSADPAVARPQVAKPAAPLPPEPKPPPSLKPELRQPWLYPLASDHGIREDKGGRGGFLAPRTHGKHNGLDLLAPIGTELRAPCNGSAKSSVSRSFGKWVKVVCPIPAEIAASRSAYASIFFSHLDSSRIDEKKDVRRGERLGTVGKSGNASGSSIAPHVHVEIVVHDTEARAMEERHSGRDQSSTGAAKRIAAALEEQCLAPNGFSAKDHSLTRARRLDPFVVLSCLSDEKPDLAAPKGSLASASVAWSKQYSAKTFDVDLGREPAKP